jgi:uncharacterized membrane protein
MSQFQRYLITGMLVWVPLIITAWFTWFAVARVGGSIESIVRFLLERTNALGERVPGLSFLSMIEYHPGTGILLSVAVFLATGLFARYLVTRRLIHAGESLVNQLPIINRVYRAVQQIRDVFVGRGAVFQEVVLVQYPRLGIYSVGFLTSEDQGLVQAGTGEEMIAVFVPTTPNPTSGFLLYFQPAEVIRLDISVEEGMKLILSAGAYQPVARGEAVQTRGLPPEKR